MSTPSQRKARRHRVRRRQAKRRARAARALLDQNAVTVIKTVKSMKDASIIRAAIAEEAFGEEGKERKTVLAALRDRLEELADPPKVSR